MSKYSVRVLQGKYNMLDYNQVDTQVIFTTPEKMYSILNNIERSEHFLDYGGTWSGLVIEALDMWLKSVWVSSKKAENEALKTWLEDPINAREVDKCFIQHEREKLSRRMRDIEFQLVSLDAMEKAILGVEEG